MSAAQDEFNQLVNSNKATFSTHPEDRDNSDHSSDENDSTHHDDYILDDEDDESAMASRTGTCHIPNTVFDANTGPKGVIADAQAFERARKRSFRRTLLGAAGVDHHRSPKSTDDANLLQNSSPPDGSGSEDEDRFMRKWRESRMQELQGHNQRRSSPRRRMYGTFKAVDAGGYLDAIEKVNPGTTTVVCIYDPEVRYMVPGFMFHMLTLSIVQC